MKTAQQFAKQYKLRTNFVELIDKNYSSNWTRKEIELFHTDDLIGKTVKLTVNARNGSETNEYTITSIAINELSAGTVRVKILKNGNPTGNAFFLRKDLKTLGGVTLPGLLKGKETVDFLGNIIFQ